MSERRYPQPSTEQGFEDFCLVLMRDFWGLPTLERFGHRGERQYGVDLLDLGQSIELKAVQCKHHGPNMTLPPAELEAEVAQAQTLQEPLAEYWVLTTAKKSTATQTKVREINKDHGARSLFIVVVKFWDDIELMIDASAAAQRHLELRTPEATIAAVRSAVGDVIAPFTAGVLHAELDAAKAHVEAGELAEAQVELRKVRSHAWSNLSPAQRARWLTLRADVVLRQGNTKEAAQLLLEAHDHTPDDELALVNAVSAKRLLDDPGSEPLAARARERFPSSPVTWAACVEAAADAARAAAVIAEMPAHVRETPAVALAIACRPDLRTQFPDAPAHAAAVAPEDVRGWFHHGMQLFEGEIRNLDPDSWDRSPIDAAAISEATAAFSRVVDLAARQGRPMLRVEGLVRRAALRALIGDLEGARSDVEAANAIAPSSVEVTMARARLHLDDGSTGPAIPLIREALQRGGVADADVTLALALWNRNGPGDRDESTAMMRARAERGDDRGVAHAMALDGMLAAGKLEDAEQFLSQSAARLGDVEHLVLEGRLRLAADQRDLAARAAVAALGKLTTEAPRRWAVGVSRLLVQLGRHQEAVSVLERLAADMTDIESVRALVLCAGRLDRHGDVLSVCARCRESGIYDDYLLSVELPLLDRYDPNQALSVLEAFLVRNPSVHGARVHLASLAHRLEREDIVDRELALLPTVAEVDDAEEGGAVVQLLRARGRSLDATTYAYDLLRRFFASPEAHRALIQAVLWRDREADDSAGVDADTVVRAGHAVCLREHGADHWFVLEDSTVPATGLEGEIKPTQELWQRLIGRTVGDEIELAQTGGMSRKTRITQVLPKVVFRWRDAMSQWQYRFPEHQELWMMRAEKEETGEVDAESFIAVLKEQRDRVEHALGVYRAQPVPVCMLGKALGHDVFTTALRVAQATDLPVRCCFGTVDERGAAFRSLDSATALVLDATAVSTLYNLAVLELVRGAMKRMLLPHSVMALVRAFALDPANRERRADQGAEAAVAGPASQGNTTNVARSAASFKTGVEQVTVATGSIALASMAPDLRRRLSRILDESTLDAIAMASAPGRLLWTDDLAVAQLARAELGVASVWTQGVLMWMCERGMLSEPDYAGATSMLVGLNYRFTSLSPVVVTHAARLAEWSPARWPLTQTIDQLGVSDVCPQDAAHLAATLVRDAFAEPLPVERRQEVLFATCASLSARSDHPSAMDGLALILPRIFGLNVVGQSQAMTALRAWTNPPRIVLPRGAPRP